EMALVKGRMRLSREAKLLAEFLSERLTPAAAELA
ncbi:hypothetical protein J2W52_005603, partial [Rhizobium miluonense]|nr:hypothetical protein [Rhizobium miluonense]